MSGHHEDMAAYGGSRWRPRDRALAQELGSLWGSCGLCDEWSPLRSVVLHRPGAELDRGGADPEGSLWVSALDADRARRQHDELLKIYEASGVTVHSLSPPEAATLTPNQMFLADLFLMTPEGAIVGRPASEVRAGEERWLSLRLAALGVPILRTLRGEGTFEGADALWLDRGTVLLGRGLRTNAEGALQVETTLRELGVEVILVDLPFGTMHLMGALRIIDRDLAVHWPGRLAWAAVEALRARGYRTLTVPDEAEAQLGHALNVVTLGPREIVAPAGSPKTQAFFEDLGVTVHAVAVDELTKAAGAIGCLTGVLERAERR